MLESARSSLRVYWERGDSALHRRIARAAAARNRACAEWAVSLLDVEPSFQVLQVGDLAGDTLASLAGMAAQGLIVGIDQRPAICSAARRRHRASLAGGNLGLVQAEMDRLPFAEDTFDAVLSFGSADLWHARERSGVRELKRVLRSGGTMALCTQPRRARRDQQIRDAGTRLKNQVMAAGFEKVRLVYRPLRPVAAICVLGSAC